MTRSIWVGARSLPITHSADVLIVSGSFAGISAAVECARAGRWTALLEPRTYLGREITATLRPWIVQLGDQSALWRDLAARMDLRPAGAEVPLKMDALKRVLEDLCLEAGVELIYASQPTGICRAENAVAGLVIGNKSGRQVLPAPAHI